MRINSSGNVGIGTTSPAAKLSVDGSAIFNEGGGDNDFRVESDNNANMLFVDAGNDRVGVGTTSPSGVLNVVGDNSVPQMRIDTAGTGQNARLELAARSTAGTFCISRLLSVSEEDGLASAMTIETRNSLGTIAERMRLDSSGVLFLGVPGGNSTAIIQGTSGAGSTNQPGTDLHLKGGSGGGTGGSKIKFFTAPGGSSGTAESAATQVAVFDESGNLLVGTTTSPSDTGTVVADGIYLGGTAAANLLEDYEEGTWTPTLVAASGFSSITYDAIRGGQYTKIGNLVYCQGIMRTDAISGGSGNVSIGGLPFTAGGNVSGNAGSSGVFTFGETSFAGDHPYGGEVGASTTSALLFYRATSNGGFSILQANDLGTGANANQFRFVIWYQV